MKHRKRCAISTGEVDALVVYGQEGERIYTLQGADYAYRVMVESIHEGAANLAADGTVLYCNKRLAEMLERPLEQVLGSSFFKYLEEEEQPAFAALTQKGLERFDRQEFNLLREAPGPLRETLGPLRAALGPLPVLISASAAEVDGRRGVCLVITDLSEQKLAAARERELQARLMDQREDERMHIARNIHDGPLQDLLGLSYMLQAMITDGSRPAENQDLQEIRASILKLASDLRAVCNDLRPPNIIRFGLGKAIRYHLHEFQEKNPEYSVQLHISGEQQDLPDYVSTALYRIYQESMTNIVRHAQARRIFISLEQDESDVLLKVGDDGRGFTLPDDWVEMARKGHLGLVGMRERAEAAGGKLRISAGAGGTTIQVRVPRQTPDADG